MTEDQRKTVTFLLWIFLLVLLALGYLASLGCKTCPPPTVIKEPVEVEVPVPVQGDPLEVEHPPQPVVCNQVSIKELSECIGGNMKRLQIWATAAWGEIKRHNEAIETE